MDDLQEQRTKLSHDVMIDILKRLPATSLIRFKCVSKDWYSLINSPDFISIHYNYDSLSNHFIFFKRYLRIEESTDSIYYNGTNMLSFHSNDESFKFIAPNIEYSDNYVGVNIAGPCNGIICISSYRSILLYNPTLREFWELPPSILPPPPYISTDSKKLSYHMTMNMGIGFDSNTNDYKIVRILNSSYEHECDEFDNYNKYVSTVEVYRLSTNCWRKIEDLECIVDSFHFSHVLFNGAFHWVGYTESDDYCIVSFDFSTESFKQIPSPEGLFSDGRKSPNPFVLKQTLTLICFTEIHYPPEEVFHQSIDIWVMKIYGVRNSWIKEFTVGPLLIKAPLSVWMNDTELMMESYNGKLVSCNLLLQETKDLDMYGVPQTLEAIVCKESLVSIKKERERNSPDLTPLSYMAY